jgi:uncharacterized protein (DUF1800 family)
MKAALGVATLFIASIGLLLAPVSYAVEDSTIQLSLTNGTQILDLPLVSGVEEFKILGTTNLGEPFSVVGGGNLSGYLWMTPAAGGLQFYKVEMIEKSSNAVSSANLLNRIAYGPTPDELERVSQLGPEAYIAEQLAPEKIAENLAIDEIKTGSDWQFVTMTGTGSSSILYIYLDRASDCYIDDIKVVRGSVAEVGANLLANGDFENGLTSWTVSTNLTASGVDSTQFHSGNSGLHVISDSEGSSQDTSIYTTITPALSSSQTYTLSYWYKPGANRNARLTVRLSGSGLNSSPNNIATRLELGSATIDDLRAWHVLHAVQSKKQLQEVLLQFLENHFVTQYSKSSDYLDGFYDDNEQTLHATRMEYMENKLWRQALQNPQCTFYDLLKISAESPAMIIYLDTVNSKGNGANIANENYARELLELFCFGVDNGYDQNDITVMSRAWTGWSVRLVDPTNEFNPFAAQTKKLRPGGTNDTQIDNLDGVWAFGYKPGNHNVREKVIFPGKTVPPRFGPPYAGVNYELKLPAGSGTNWQYVTKTGTASSSILYMYLTGTGDCYIDDIKVVPGSVAEGGTNAIINGDFESGLSGWTVAANLSGSTVVTDGTHSGSGALHLVSSAAGSSRSTSISRANLGLATDQPYTLSYWYKAGTSSDGDLVVRLSGSGLESTPGASTNSVEEGYKVLAHFANQPFTQEFISVKLCRLFVHEDFATGYDFTSPNLSPEGKLVRECMRAWEDNAPKGQIRKVLDTIFHSELFRTQAAAMQKVKTPLEYTVSAIRTLRAQSTDGTFTADTDGYAISGGQGNSSKLDRMGRMRLFDRDSPDGYAEGGASWISAGTLAERLRYIQALLIARGQTGHSDVGNNNTTDPVKLLKLKMPSTDWNNAEKVADYFLSILYPGEGKANLDDLKSLAVSFLNTGDDGVTSSQFSALVNTTAYDTRVRGMVAMLMTSQRFQEQ